MAQGGLLTPGDRGAAPSPDALLAELRAAAGDPPLPPLRIAEPAPSARAGLPGRAVSTVRRQVLRLISPALGELLAELERDRHRQRAEIAALRARLDELERRGAAGGG
ncbi:MAG: hypothetical protein U0237_00090 [Thermoleophilia bacterium]